MTQAHFVEAECLLGRDDGFYDARCVCGFEAGPMPGIEEVVDVLMAHALDVGAHLTQKGAST